MSRETKQHAETAKQHLKWAIDSLNDAKNSAEKTGDSKLVEKIKSNKESVEKTKKDLSDKLDEKRGDK